MRKIKLSLIALLLASFGAVNAQTIVKINEKGVRIAKDETEITINDRGLFMEEAPSPVKKYDPNKWKPSRGTFAGVFLNYNGLIQSLSEMHLPDDARFMDLTPASIGVDINFTDLVIYSYKRFGIVTGLGLECNNFRFENNVTLTKDAAGYIVPDYSYDNDGIKLQKSKLTTTYLNIPLLFEFKLGKLGYRGNSPGWISAGVVGGVLLQGYTKVKASEIGKHKEFNNQNLRNFHYGFMVTGGYRYIGLTAKYYPHSIFRADEGPRVQQVSLGLGLVF